MVSHRPIKAAWAQAFPDMATISFGVVTEAGAPAVKLIDEVTGQELTEPNQKGVVAIEGPLPPGCMTTIWNDDARFLSSYFSHFKELLYSSLDWAIRDADGYTFILGRTDDVINVAGHRLGTREIEESVSGFAAVAEAAEKGDEDDDAAAVAEAKLKKEKEIEFQKWNLESLLPIS